MLFRDPSLRSPAMLNELGCRAWACLIFLAVSLGFSSAILAQTIEIRTSVRPLPPASRDVKLNGPISAIAVDPTDEQNALVASEFGGVFRTSDAGLHWVHVDALLTDRVNAIAYLQSGGMHRDRIKRVRGGRRRNLGVSRTAVANLGQAWSGNRVSDSSLTMPGKTWDLGRSGCVGFGRGPGHAANLRCD